MVNFKSDITKEICDILRCPKGYLSTLSQTTTEEAEELVLLCHRDWIQQMKKEKCIPEEFMLYSSLSEKEIEALVADRQLGPSHLDWCLLTLRIIPRNFIPSSFKTNKKKNNDRINQKSTLPEILQNLNDNYLERTWKVRSENKKDISTHSPHILETTWEEDILHFASNFSTQEMPILCISEQGTQHNTEMFKPASSGGPEAGLTRLQCLVFTDEAAILFQKYHPVSVTQMIKFSPAILLDINLKYLFVFYQILRIYEELHAKETYLGQDVYLSQFKITENLHVQFEPKFTLKKRKKIESSSTMNVDNYIEKLSLSKKAEDCTYLGEATTKWCNGELTNLDYLLVLNHAAGRRFGQPNNHPVVPWVCDFSTKEGGERDLSKSKFRLNKGDAALDLTYESGAHHVTDVLSEITYYTYKSRITDREVLCRYVRPNWVPAEYPSSMKRMMSWSPDEAIPEFYTDPKIFSSIHSDLPELELPDWTRTAEEFCDWHRARLESPEVSAQLHSWIDLTFGYKLSGGAAIRNKNVSLSISDSHTDLRPHGVLQLFSLPHPVKVKKSKIIGVPFLCLQSQTSEGDNVNAESDDGGEEYSDSKSYLSQTKIVLPEDFDPMAELMRLEAVHSFQTKSGVLNYQTLDTEGHTFENFKSEDNVLLRDDLRVLGCLLVELFLHKKCLTLQPQSSFEVRLQFAKQHLKSLPANVRNLGEILFDLEENGCENPFLPPPPVSVSKLTHPLTSIAHFPESFGPITKMLGLTADMEETRDECFGEFCVTVIARTLSPLLGSMTPECLELVVPMMQQLLQTADKTAVLAAWLLFDNVSSALGNERTTAKFLERINTLYMNGTTTAKHAKLYHRTFLLSLIVRFKMRSFLGHFIHPLIEAVGGYKDLEWDCDRRGLDDTIISDKKEDTQGGGSVTSQLSNNIIKIQSGDAFSDGEVFAFDGMEDGDNISKHSDLDVDIETLETVTQNLSRVRHISNESLNGIIDLDSMTRVMENAEDRRQEDTNISSVASESVMWLAQRLGPVLACRHLSRNLLRMLALCYAGPEGVRDTGRPHRDQKIRVSGTRVTGDLTAEPVLECLSQLVGLYGDSLVVVQYLPHCWDLVSRAKRRISPSLESCLLAAASVAHTSIPLLSDSVLMNELPHSVLAHVLAPVLQVTTSRRVMFMSGSRARLVLLYKILDALYIIGLRIGEEMARIHLTPLATGFFSALDKMELIEAGADADVNDDNGTLTQLKQVLTPTTVFAAYVCFHQLLGGAHLEASLSNGDLVKRLLKVYHHSSALLRPVHRPASFLELQGLPNTSHFSSTSYGGSGQSGNMIVVSQEGGDTAESSNDFHMINKPAVDSGRHLRGNWLAYWEHELGKDDRDNSFNFKQIKLQSFTGHVGGVKSLHVLDNENSFLSGGRDKVVRLWSVRNAGEGDTQVSSQSLFSGHKRSVFYVSFLTGPGHAVSCDGGLVVWDPWVMATVAEYECPGTKTSFCAARTISDPGHVILAATSDGTVRLLDTRDKQSQRSGCELRVSQGAAGLIRSLAVNRDGHQIAVGHSSGYISMLDIRTGRLKTGFKAHDGEVLTLTDVNKHFVSTSLDQLASGWRWEDGRQAASLRAFPEPLHCVASYEDTEVIMGSTANRLIFQRSVETDSPSTVHKLKGDLIKGNLSQMCVLPLNKQLLLASDAGNIYLVC